jgi:hypothetical protein
MHPLERRLQVELVGPELGPRPFAPERQEAPDAAQPKPEPLPRPQLAVERGNVNREVGLVVAGVERAALDLDVRRRCSRRALTLSSGPPRTA